jgi:hypothetical protein
MAYGTVKVDTIIFDQGGTDQNVTASGIYRAITSGVTVTGTISGAVLIGTTTVSGATVTGTAVQGTTVQGVSGTFTSLTGTTTTGTTANFVSGIFTTRISGTTVTGDTGQFTSGTFVSLTGTTITGTTINAVTVSSTTGTFTSLTGTTITGTTINGVTVAATTGSFTSLTGTTTSGTTANFVSGVFTTQVSGTTVTGTTSNFTSGNFATLSGATATFTSGVIALGTATNPSLSFTGDPNTGIYSPGADQLAVATNGTGRLFVDASGQVGVGAAPTIRLEVARLGTTWTGAAALAGTALFLHNGNNSTSSPANLQISTGNATAGRIYFGDSDNATKGLIEYDHTDDHLHLSTNGAERLRIDSSGRLLVGTSTSYNAPSITGTQNASLNQTHSATAGIGSQLIAEWSTSTASGGSSLKLAKSNSGTVGTHTALSVNQDIGSLVFAASDGSNFINAATILAEVDDTPGTNDMPGRLVFSVTADGSASPTERLRITSAGRVGIGTTSPATTLDVNGDVTISDKIIHAGDTNTAIRFPAGDTVTVETAGSERARIDSSGRLLVGPAASSIPTAGFEGGLQLHNDAITSGAQLSLVKFNTDTGGSVLVLGKSKSATIVAGAVVANNDTLGTISFVGDDGTDLASRGASIICSVDGTPGANDMPGRLVFSTTADGSASPTERLRITSAGNVGIGTSSPDVNLHVNSTGNTVIKVSSTFADSITTGYRVDTTGNASIGRIDFQKSGATRGKISYVHNATAAAELLGFNVAGGADKLVIDGAGNVGIGTASPTTLLDVNADTVRVRTARTPASASATGATGEICWDANYIYVCTATNTWKRSAISTW